MISMSSITCPSIHPSIHVLLMHAKCLSKFRKVTHSIDCTILLLTLLSRKRCFSMIIMGPLLSSNSIVCRVTIRIQYIQGAYAVMHSTSCFYTAQCIFCRFVWIGGKRERESLFPILNHPAFFQMVGRNAAEQPYLSIQRLHYITE